MVTHIFVDSDADMNEILSITNDQSVKIISFDILAHKKLEKFNIEHDLIENYHDENDDELINQLVLKHSFNWYKLSSISKSLQLDNFNLGWLLEIEITWFFLKTIKNFLGIIRIMAKNDVVNVVTSKYLGSIIKSLDIKNVVTIQYYKAYLEPSLAFDNVLIPINIGKKVFSLKFSRKFILKIKHISEIFFKYFLKIFITPNLKNKNMLLLEFNIPLYKDLIKDLSKQFNIILLNEKRPAIWNFSSFCTVVKTKSQVLLLKNFLDSNIKFKLNQKRQDFYSQLLKELENNKQLENFFSIENSSYWNVIKNSFIKMCLARFDEALFRNELSKTLFEKMNIHSILTMYNTGAEEKVILSVAQNKNIPGILLQHGIYPQNNYSKRFLPIFTIVPTLGLTKAVWGDILENYLLSLGVSSNSILKIGSPRHDKFFHQNQNSITNNTILLASNFPMENDSYAIDTKNYINFEKLFKEICLLSNSIHDKRLVVKLHPGYSSMFDTRSIINEIDSSIPIFQNQDIFDFLKKCEVLICVDFSTVLLDAMILGKPTITFLTNHRLYENEEIFTSGASILVKSSEEFKQALDAILNDPIFRKNLIDKGTNFVEKYMSNRGVASNKLSLILKDFSSEHKFINKK